MYPSPFSFFLSFLMMTLTFTLFSLSLQSFAHSFIQSFSNSKEKSRVDSGNEQTDGCPPTIFSLLSTLNTEFTQKQTTFDSFSWEFIGNDKSRRIEISHPLFLLFNSTRIKSQFILLLFCCDVNVEEKENEREKEREIEKCVCSLLPDGRQLLIYYLPCRIVMKRNDTATFSYVLLSHFKSSFLLNAQCTELMYTEIKQKWWMIMREAQAQN